MGVGCVCGGEGCVCVRACLRDCWGDCVCVCVRVSVGMVCLLSCVCGRILFILNLIAVIIIIQATQLFLQA